MERALVRYGPSVVLGILRSLVEEVQCNDTGNSLAAPCASRAHVLIAMIVQTACHNNPQQAERYLRMVAAFYPYTRDQEARHTCNARTGCSCKHPPPQNICWKSITQLACSRQWACSCCSAPTENLACHNGKEVGRTEAIRSYLYYTCVS